MEERKRKNIAQNRKARHDYHIGDVIETGIELYGTEVKSLRNGNVNLKDSYVSVKNGEMFVVGMHISPYEKGNIFNRDPLRMRRLLLHKRQIRKLALEVKQGGYTIVPLNLYFSGQYVKLEIALAKGKKLYDKRDSAAKRDSEMAARRYVKG